MHSIFRFDSPIVQKLAMLGNLIFLNLLWLVSCLPLFTIGAATTAMYQVIFMYLTGMEDAVIKPYFQSFLSNFKQATILWLGILIVSIILAFDFIYLYVYVASWLHPLWLIFYLVAALLLIAATYVFPMTARFLNSSINIIRNSYSLFLRNFFPSLMILLLNLLPWVIMLLSPNFFLEISIFWFLIGFSLCAYCNGKVFLKIFCKYHV